MAWIQGWRAMDIKVIESPPSQADPLVSKAMDILREQLAQKDSGLSHVASSAAYRSEDFSVPQEDGSRKFFTNHIFGAMRDATQDPTAARSETAGALRHAGDNVLTDQPQEEVYATVHDKTLERGHSGVVLDVPPGTRIDIHRDEEIDELRAKVFVVEKQRVDVDRLAAVREGRQADAQSGAQGAGMADRMGVGADGDNYNLVVPGAAAAVLAGAAALHKFAKGRGRQ